MSSPPSYENYCVANTLNGDIHFTQYTIGETDEEYIWMDRTKEQLCLDSLEAFDASSRAFFSALRFVSAVALARSR